MDINVAVTLRRDEARRNGTYETDETHAIEDIIHLRPIGPIGPISLIASERDCQ